MTFFCWLALANTYSYSQSVLDCSVDMTVSHRNPSCPNLNDGSIEVIIDSSHWVHVVMIESRDSNGNTLYLATDSLLNGRAVSAHNNLGVGTYDILVYRPNGIGQVCFSSDMVVLSTLTSNLNKNIFTSPGTTINIGEVISGNVTYLWGNGHTGAQQMVTAPTANTSYCVTVTDAAANCTFEQCYHFQISANHHYVNIPDQQFRQYLKGRLPFAFNALDQMDIYNPDVVAVTNIDCSNRGIVSLEGLQYFTQLNNLDCSDNRLTILPPLPSSLLSIYCSNNLIACFPLLPNGLRTLNFYNTFANCIPNQPLNCNFNPFTPSLCPNMGCQQAAYLNGRVYYDVNNNNIYDPSDHILEDIVLTNTSTPYSVLSTGTGYSMPTTPFSTSTLVATNPFPSAWNMTVGGASCTSQGSGTSAPCIDFRVRALPQAIPVVISIANTEARPGFSTTATATLRNISHQPQNDITVSIQVPAGWSLTGTYPSGGTLVNGEVVWQQVNLPALSTDNFTVHLSLPTNTPLGQPFDYVASVLFSESDAIVSASVSGVVIGSYDPNDKLVDKATIPDVNTSSEELAYTVRFQNTGTASAINVRIHDEISNHLDLSTLRIVGASHAYQAKIEPFRVLEVSFPNIHLPDSFSNEPLSHGFVKFTIKPKANLVTGTVIENKAGIYFDFNEPVITNVARTVVTCINAQLTGAGDGMLCDGEVAQLAVVAQGGNGQFNYLWNNGATNQSINTTPILPTLYRVTVSDGSGCPTLVREVVIASVESPDVSFQQFVDPNGMPADAVYVANTSPIDFRYTYSWDFGDGTTSNAYYPAHTYATAGPYQLCLAIMDNITGCQESFCQTVAGSGVAGFTLNVFPASVLDLISSTETIQSPLSPKVWPNPAADFINIALDGISLGDIEILLEDAMGRVVVRMNHSFNEKETAVLPMAGLPAGTYLVRLISQGRVSTTKVVKM